MISCTENRDDDAAARRRRAANAIEVLYATGHTLLARHQFAEAASVCRTMLTLAPHDERGWLALGACHEGLAEHELALQLYAVGHAMSRSGARCELARFRLLRTMGDAEQAEASLIRARQRAESIADPALSMLIDSEARFS